MSPATSASGAGCAGPAVLVFDPELTRYDFGVGHPMAPVRVELTLALAEQLGVLADPHLAVAGAAAVDDALLHAVHDPAYTDAVRRAGEACARGERPAADGATGLGSEENPVFARMHEASAHVVGASVEAARLVWSGEALHAVNIVGGLHHAMPDRAAGFCVYNDVAVAIAWLLDHGVERVAYVDVDVHHGDGVEAVFWDDPRVLTVSLHETGEHLFPGTGGSDDVGGPAALGTAVNVPLPSGTDDAGWLRAFHAVVPDAVRDFAPQVLVTQHGCDSHVRDPLAHLALSVDGQRVAHEALHDLAHEVCGGRWVVTGGGGYALAEVVPRSWTHLLATAAGRPLDPATALPRAWLERVEELLGEEVPDRMTDGREPRHTAWPDDVDPASPLDRAVLATRDALARHRRGTATG